IPAMLRSTILSWSSNRPMRRRSQTRISARSGSSDATNHYRNFGRDNGRLSEVIVARLPCPLYPRKLPRQSPTGVSVKGQKQTSPCFLRQGIEIPYGLAQGGRP